MRLRNTMLANFKRRLQINTHIKQRSQLGKEQITPTHVLHSKTCMLCSIQKQTCDMRLRNKPRDSKFKSQTLLQYEKRKTKSARCSMAAVLLIDEECGRGDETDKAQVVLADRLLSGPRCAMYQIYPTSRRRSNGCREMKRPHTHIHIMQSIYILHLPPSRSLFFTPRVGRCCNAAAL